MKEEIIKEEIIKNETAIISREKGFDIENKLPAPTQSLLQKWLRKIHDIDVIIEVHNEKYLIMLFKGLHNKNIKYYEANISLLFDIYEDALEVGLIEGLKLIDQI